MTATTATGAPGVRWRAAARAMPTGVAAVFLALLAASALVMVLVLAAGLVGELSERLAAAGWAKARAIHAVYPPPPTPGSGQYADDPAVAHA